MSKTNFVVDINNYQRAVRIPRLAITQMLTRAYRLLKLTRVELSVVFLSPLKMRQLNQQSLGHDYVTDVITFNYATQKRQGVINGEIVVCPYQAKMQARELKVKLNDELVLYVAHGLLHLCGYDDHTSEQITLMRKMEKKLLS